MSFAGLTIQNLSQSFQGKKILEKMHLQIEQGSFVSILGRSGSGKSTLLRILAGLDEPASGSVQWPTSVSKISFVFQDANLLEWRNVFKNVHLPLELESSALSKDGKEKRVQETLQKLKLQDLQDLYPAQLSGGMKMRVSLARALVTNPQVLLLDEPFAALDEGTRFELQDLLLSLQQQQKMTVLFVTHSIFEAVYLSQRLLMLGPSLGTIIMDETLQLPTQRSTELRTSEALNQIARRVSLRLQQ